MHSSLRRSIFVKNNEDTRQTASLLAKLDSPNASDSFDSMEGAANRSERLNHFTRETLPVIAYAAASAGHLVAGLGQMTEVIPKPVTDFLDKYILGFSKLVNVVNYTQKGVEAVNDKRAWEGLSRLAYSAIVPFMPLESVFTASGISSGPTMFEQAQRHKIKYKNASEENPQGTASSISEDLRENFKAFKTMCTETLSNLSGENRKVFVHPDKEQGHTMFLCAWGNFLGAIGGIAAGSDHHSLLAKGSSIIRNLGGIGCDWAKFIHPDINNKLSAIFYGIVSICDVAKSFTPEPVSHILSHFSMAMNNFANYYYVNTSKATTDKTFKDYKAVGNENT